MTEEEMLEIVKKINTQLEEIREEVNQLLSNVTEENDPYGRVASADWYLEGLQKDFKWYAKNFIKRD